MRMPSFAGQGKRRASGRGREWKTRVEDRKERDLQELKSDQGECARGRRLVPTTRGCRACWVRGSHLTAASRWPSMETSAATSASPQLFIARLLQLRCTKSSTAAACPSAPVPADASCTRAGMLSDTIAAVAGAALTLRGALWWGGGGRKCRREKSEGDHHGGEAKGGSICVRKQRGQRQ